MDQGLLHMGATLGAPLAAPTKAIQPAHDIGQTRAHRVAGIECAYARRCSTFESQRFYERVRSCRYRLKIGRARQKSHSNQRARRTAAA